MPAASATPVNNPNSVTDANGSSPGPSPVPTGTNRFSRVKSRGGARNQYVDVMGELREMILLSSALFHLSSVTLSSGDL